MKTIALLLVAAYLTAGCASGMTHDDNPGATNDPVPALCRDGTTPPCNDRGFAPKIS